MAEYKRKKMRHSTRTAPKIKRQPLPEKPVKEPKPKKASEKRKLNVIEGKKPRHSRRLRITAIIAAVLIIAIVILHFVLPIGIIEVVGNRLAAMGLGHYPREIYGTETLNSVSKGYYYYVLTNQELDAYSTGGKKIFSKSHGFAHPILTCGETRALLYDQGGTQLLIYNLRKKTNDKVCAEAIQTAALGRDGSYVVVTASDSYASVVSVYNRKNKKVYEWYSAKDLVSHAAISPDGKKIAIATVNATAGQLHSKILMFGFSSANPIETLDFSDSVICGIENLSNCFAVLSDHSATVVRWKNGSRRDYPFETELFISRKTNNGLTLVFNRSSNRQENQIIVFSPKGKKVSEFNFKGIINDIAYAHGRLYCLSETDLYLLSDSGKELCHQTCEYGVKRLAVLGSDSMAIITNSQIKKVNLND